MSIEYQKGSWNAGSTAQEVYTCPRGRTAVIVAASLLNIDSGAQTASLYLVNSGESPEDQNKVVSDRSFEADESWLGYPIIGHALREGDAIYMECSLNGAINLRWTVKEIF